MNARTAIAGTVLTLLASPALASTSSLGTRCERSALRSLEDPSLERQRGGAVALRASLNETEQTALRSAEAASSQLAEMRAGDLHLSDHDLTIIAIVAAVVLIIVIIA
ncbi:MAG: hypothetical protein ACKVXR_18575 [Planctomycetota bacterium]